MKLVLLLLEYGADSSATYEELKMTVIHLLLKGGIELDCFLDDPGVRLEARDGMRSTLFLDSCQSTEEGRGKISSAEEDFVFRMMARGAGINSHDYQSKNSLHNIWGRATAFKHPVEQAPELVKQQDKDGNTPLH